MDSVQNLVFDNVYHEHISYFSVKPLQAFFKEHGMELIRVDRVPTKGGSIRGTVQLKGGIRHVELSVDNLVNMEIEGDFISPTCTRNSPVILIAKKEIAGTVKGIEGSGQDHCRLWSLA